MNDTGRIGFWLKLLAGFWMLFVFGTYLFHHPYITQSIGAFDYWKPLFFSLFASGVWYGFATKFKFTEGNNFSYRPWQLVLVFSLICFFTYYQILAKTLPESSPINDFTRNFFVLSGKHLLLLGLFCLSGFSIGALILRLVDKKRRADEVFLISIALGWSAMGLMVFLESLIHPVSFEFSAAIFIISLIFEYKSVIRLATQFFKRREVKFNWTFIPMFATIALMLSYAWISAHKLYAVGYDGVTLYGNLANLFGKEGLVAKGFQPYNWSLMMGLGLRWFKSEAMMFLIGYLPGFLLVPLIYRLARRFISSTASMAVLVLWLCVPAAMYHYGNTEKIDLAISFFVLAGLSFYFEYIFTKMKDIGRSALRWSTREYMMVCWLVLGFLLGFALGVKLTTIFILFAFAGIVFYHGGGYPLFRWGFLFLLGLFYMVGIYQISGMLYGSYITRSLGFILLAVSIYELRKYWPEQRILFGNITKLFLALAIGMVISFGPWPVKNLVESSNKNMITMMQGETQAPSIDVMAGVNEKDRLSAQAKLAGLVFMGTSRREEMGKFLGFDEGFYKYFTVLFKISTNPNVRNRIFVDAGFYLLMMLPFFLFFYRKKEGYDIKKILPALAFVFLYIALSTYIIWQQPGMPSISDPRSMLDQHSSTWASALGVFPHAIGQLFYHIGSVFDYIPLLGNSAFRFLNIILAIVFLVLIRKMTLPYFQELDKKSRALLIVSACYLFIWYITGTGIAWYAFPIIPVLFIACQKYFSLKESFWNQYNGIAVALVIFFMIPLRYSNVSSGSAQENDQIIPNSSLLYSSGFMEDKETIQNSINPSYVQISSIINADPEAKIYLAGTLMNYFIDGNYKRVHQDNQLAEFDAISRIESDNPSYFVEVLKKNGFKYILFNPSDINYDKTPEQSHKKKFEQFWSLMQNPDGLRLRATNHKVQNMSGEVMTGLRGPVASYGTVALMEIL